MVIVKAQAFAYYYVHYYATERRTYTLVFTRYEKSKKT